MVTFETIKAEEVKQQREQERASLSKTALSALNSFSAKKKRRKK